MDGKQFGHKWVEVRKSGKGAAEETGTATAKGEGKGKHGKGKGKNKDWGEGRQKWRKDRPRDAKPEGHKGPRRAVDSPLLQAVRTLLHHPHLAAHVQQANQLADENEDEARLLVALIEAAQKQPGLTWLQTVEPFQDWCMTG